MSAQAESKRKAAQEQVTQMRANGFTDQDIAAQLEKVGLSKAQIEDLLPKLKPEPPKPEFATSEEARVILEATASFLDSLGARVNKYADRYPDLGTIRNECLGVARRLRKVKP